MTIQEPPRIWWRPIPGQERLYIGAATAFALLTWVLMPLWHFTGLQNPEMRSYRVETSSYQKKVDDFVKQYRVRDEAGLPVVAPPAGGDVYVLGRTFQWYPIVQLKRGQTYKLHLSSIDVQHGFSIARINLNFMVIPNYEYILQITPTDVGDYGVVCNEYCGLGHHLMVGKIRVE